MTMVTTTTVVMISKVVNVVISTTRKPTALPRVRVAVAEEEY